MRAIIGGSGRALRRHLAAALASLALLAPPGCTDRRAIATAAAEETLRTAPERAILVECREGFSGDVRSWHIAVTRDGTRRAPGAEPEGAPLTIADAGGAAQAAFVDYDAACRRASVETLDAIEAAGVPADWDLPDVARKYHLLVPNAPRTHALLMSRIGHCERLVDLSTLKSTPARGEPFERAGTVTWSGGGRHFAFSQASESRDATTMRLLVYDVAQHAVVNDIRIGRWIRDIAWSPDGTRLAVLCFDEREGHGPLELLGASMGHGVPYDDYELLVVDLATSAVRSVPVAEDLKYGAAFVLWDRRAVRSTACEF